VRGTLTRDEGQPSAVAAIAVTAAMLRHSRARSFTLDGEAVLSGVDGVAVFDTLHRRPKVTNGACETLQAR
jgi:hypothetical protein